VSEGNRVRLLAATFVLLAATCAVLSLVLGGWL